jgi:anti-sigma regulatory factor (Ser/Thr protein kinase)
MRLDISGEERAQESAFQAVEKLLRASLADEGQRELFLLAFVEALANAVEHGNQGDSAAGVLVEAAGAPGVAAFSITDQGRGHAPMIPELSQVQGKRGRGLAFIQLYSDNLFFNRGGSQIVCLKGGQTMIQETAHATARVSLLPQGVVVVTDINTRESVFSGVGELLDALSQHNWRRIFLDLKGIRLITSAVWGYIFAEAGREQSELLVLFNAPQAVMASAEAMGVKVRRGDYAKIRVYEDAEEAFRLLAAALERPSGAS